MIAVILLTIILKQLLPYLIFAALAVGYVIIRHRSNISRILAREEPKVGQSWQQENS